MRHHLIPALVALLCSGFAANAQQVGEYDGVTTDGSAVEIDVAQDPGNSNLEVTLLSFDLSMLCDKSGETLKHIGIGLNDGADIIGGQFSFSSYNFYSTDLVTSMTFHGLDTIKGTVGGNLAAFNPALTHNTLTKKVQVCVSPKQKFKATFVGPARHSILPGTVQVRNQPLIVK